MPPSAFEGIEKMGMVEALQPSEKVIEKKFDAWDQKQRNEFCKAYHNSADMKSLFPNFTLRPAEIENFARDVSKLMNNSSEKMNFNKFKELWTGNPASRLADNNQLKILQKTYYKANDWNPGLSSTSKTFTAYRNTQQNRSKAGQPEKSQPKIEIGQQRRPKNK